MAVGKNRNGLEILFLVMVQAFGARKRVDGLKGPRKSGAVVYRHADGQLRRAWGGFLKSHQRRWTSSTFQLLKSKTIGDDSAEPVMNKQLSADDNRFADLHDRGPTSF